MTDPHHINADPIQLFTLKRIRIMLHIKVMRIYQHWSTDPPRFHFELPRLRWERPQLEFPSVGPGDPWHFPYLWLMYPDPTPPLTNGFRIRKAKKHADPNPQHWNPQLSYLLGLVIGYYRVVSGSEAFWKAGSGSGSTTLIDRWVFTLLLGTHYLPTVPSDWRKRTVIWSYSVQPPWVQLIAPWTKYL